MSAKTGERTVFSLDLGKVVKRALLRIASIPAIDQPQFEDLAGAVLTAWEGGRLRDIIEQVARMETMDAEVLVSVCRSIKS